MNIKRLWVSALALSILAMVAACSSGSPASPAPDNQTTLAPASPIDTPTPEAEPTPSIPSGALAIFYRVTFGSNTDYLKGSGYNISWDNDTKGILRYIPETDQLDVMTRITSPSYARSSIYPVTINGRLFSYRDWSDTNRWDVDEMDIVTGDTLGTNVFTAASFTVAGDRLFYRTPINRDLFGNPRGGGRLRTVGLGTSNEEELTLPGVRLRGVGDDLISFADNTIVQRDPATGAEVSSKTLSLRLMQGIWPSERHIFYGDNALYWAVKQRVPNQIAILKVGLDGSFKQLTTVDLLEGEDAVLIDDAQEWVAIGLTGTEAPRGYIVKRVLLYNTETQVLEEIEINQNIPPSGADVGWGFQIAIMP